MSKYLTIDSCEECPYFKYDGNQQDGECYFCEAFGYWTTKRGMQNMHDRCKLPDLEDLIGK